MALLERQAGDPEMSPGVKGLLCLQKQQTAAETAGRGNRRAHREPVLTNVSKSEMTRCEE